MRTFRLCRRSDWMCRRRKLSGGWTGRVDGWTDCVDGWTGRVDDGVFNFTSELSSSHRN